MSNYNPEAYKKAERAKVRAKISCPACGKSHTKRSWQHKFCTTSCKDNYWNDEPSRRDRAHGRGYSMSAVEIDDFRQKARQPGADFGLEFFDVEDMDMSWDAHKDTH